MLTELLLSSTGKFHLVESSGPSSCGLCCGCMASKACKNTSESCVQFVMLPVSLCIYVTHTPYSEAIEDQLANAAKVI